MQSKGSPHALLSIRLAYDYNNFTAVNFKAVLLIVYYKLSCRF